MKLCYFLSHYKSHAVSGAQFIACLRSLAGRGIELVDSPRHADTVVIHNELTTIPGYFRMHPELREKRVIAYAVWETDKLPEHYRFNLSLVTEIWTCSTYSLDVLVQAGRPVALVPHVVNIPPPDLDAEARMRARIGAADGEFIFYTIVYNARNVRKGVEDTIRAFHELFPDGREARLVIKASMLPPQLAATPGVVSIPELLPADELYALHRIGDCYVSAHRSEGWGLTISDAMAAGRIVIATAHGGNMDYMNESNSLPVACRVESIRARDVATQSETLTRDMRWAYVDLDDLKRAMRRAFDERESLRSLGLQAQRDMAAYAPERVAAILASRL